MELFIALSDSFEPEYRIPVHVAAGIINKLQIKGLRSKIYELACEYEIKSLLEYVKSIICSRYTILFIKRDRKKTLLKSLFLESIIGPTREYMALKASDDIAERLITFYNDNPEVIFSISAIEAVERTKFFSEEIRSKKLIMINEIMRRVVNGGKLTKEEQELFKDCFSQIL